MRNIPKPGERWRSLDKRELTRVVEIVHADEHFTTCRTIRDDIQRQSPKKRSRTQLFVQRYAREEAARG